MPLPDRLTRPARRVRRAVLARRRLLAALLVGVAVVAGLRSVAAPAPPSTTVLTAARDLPAGAVVAADDVEAVAWPADLVPDGVVDPVGGTLAAPVAAGEPVTRARLVGASLVEADPERVAVPVRLPDAGAVGLLGPGDRIDLLATDPREGGAVPVATDVPVLAVPPPDPDAVSGQPGALVLVAARPEEVPVLADAGVRLFLTYAFAR